MGSDLHRWEAADREALGRALAEVEAERDRLRVRVSELETLTDASAVGAEMDRLLGRILDVQADAARAQDERDRLRRELEAFAREAEREGWRHSGHVAARIDTILTGEGER